MCGSDEHYFAQFAKISKHRSLLPSLSGILSKRMPKPQSEIFRKIIPRRKSGLSLPFLGEKRQGVLNEEREKISPSKLNRL